MIKIMNDCVLHSIHLHCSLCMLTYQHVEKFVLQLEIFAVSEPAARIELWRHNHVDA